MKFTESFEDFKEKLSPLAEQGEWRDLNNNQKQFRGKNGAILNWYPSTGTIQFQGKANVSRALREEVENLLFTSRPDNEPFDETNDNPFEVHSEPEPLEEVVTIANDTTSNESPESTSGDSELVNNTYNDSELVIGLVGAVGTDLEQVTKIITDRLQAFNYTAEEIRVSRQVIKELESIPESSGHYERIKNYMTVGNKIREQSKDNSALALGVAAKINELRPKSEDKPEPLPRKAFLINSLKHPDEVERFRQIYSNGFYLIGVYADEKRRFDFLTKNLRIEPHNASELMERDSDESDKFGQHTRDTFHLSDFFIHYDGNSDKFQNDIWRVIDLAFGKPYVTPTFDEYAMFMAFSASLRSADLSRQVGAVIAKDKNIISTGANDIPKAGGGLYWPEYNEEKTEIIDADDGRDYKRGEDSNVIEKRKIIEDILSKIPEEEREKFESYLKNSKIKDITEYGRVVHAEMEAILACTRNQIGLKGSDLYCTTFPCHNCAKHIIASGISKVIYVEPYPKSKAFEFHSDSISFEKNHNNHVIFEPFVGVGPRSFFDLFSMSLGSGYHLKRKNKDGSIVDWKEESGRLRVQMLPCSYIELEALAAQLLKKYMESTDEE